MKASTNYLFVLLFFLAFSCNKMEPDPSIEEESMEEEVMEEEETQIDTPQISLIYPTEGDEVHYCCFVMEWEDSENSEEYHVQVSAKRYPQAIVLDTVVTETSLEFPTALLPSEEYYLKVIPKNTNENQRVSFKIVDYLSRLHGTYDATINLYSWLLGEGSTDTTHQTKLRIYNGDNHTITYKTDHTNHHPEMPFVAERHEDYVLYEIDHSYPPLVDYLRYYIENDSIIIYSASSGNGGGGDRTIWALYE